MLSLHGLTSRSAGGSAEEILQYAEETDESAEGYYAERQRAPAAWVGSGTDTLGLAEKEYDREVMINLLEGLGPRGERLARISPRHRPGWDLTFSAPKSISAAWALADEGHRAEIEAAHEAAIRGAIGYIEAEGAVLVRSGEGGVEKEGASGLTFATFRHETSRAIDPDLHSHCLLLNLSTTAAGEWRRLDPAAIYRRKIEIGAVYRAELAARMEVLGYETERDRTSFRLRQISQPLCDKWSTRRDEINAALGGIEASGKARATAALASRSEKRHGSKEEIHARWRAEAATMGITVESTAHTRRTPTLRDVHELRPVIIDEALTSITDRKSVFTENDVRREIAIATQCRLAASDIRAVSSAALVSAEIVALPVVCDQDGRRLPPRFTTREMLVIERHLADQAVRRRAENHHNVGVAAIRTAIRETEQAAGFMLMAEQKAAVEHICTSGDGVTCVNGVAGAGKSTGLDAARRAWEVSGYRVRGAALQARAAAQLQQSAGIKSDTLAMLLSQVTPDGRFGETSDPLTPNDIVVLDEAGMVGSRQMAATVDAVGRAGAKLVLVGDHKQYQAISAGGAFAALAKRLGVATLSENLRQREKRHRNAVDQIRRGEVAEALTYYKSIGALIIAEGSGILETATQWQMDRQKVGDDRVLMLSARHDATRALNSAARTVLGRAGRGVEIAVQDREKKPAGIREFAVGDKIIFRRNNRKAKVWNGNTGVVEAIQAHAGEQSATLTVSLGQRQIQLDTRQYSSLDHGLAITGHISQGLTQERVVLHVADPQMLDLHAFYVGASRARDRTTIVISRHALDEACAAEGVEDSEPNQQLASLIRQLGRVRYKEFSADFFEDHDGLLDLDAEEIGQASNPHHEAEVERQ